MAMTILYHLHHLIEQVPRLVRYPDVLMAEQNDRELPGRHNVRQAGGVLGQLHGDDTRANTLLPGHPPELAIDPVNAWPAAQRGALPQRLLVMRRARHRHTRPDCITGP
jgi:hypothetical protein